MKTVDDGLVRWLLFPISLYMGRALRPLDGRS